MYNQKQPLGDITRKLMLLKFQNIKEDEWYIDEDKNIQKLLQFRLRGLLVFLIQGSGMQILQNPLEMLVKQLLLNKFSGLQPSNAIKTEFLTSSFHGFCLLFRNS